MKSLLLLLLLCSIQISFAQNNNSIDAYNSTINEYFVEEFDDDQNPWVGYTYDDDEAVHYEFHNGLAYLMSDGSETPAIKMITGLGYPKLENYIIESTIHYLEGEGVNSNDMFWGGAPDFSSGFRMGFNAQGQVHVMKVEDGYWVDLLPWTDNPYLEYDDFNILAVEKIGNEYHLFVNDDNFFSFKADPIPSNHDLTGFVADGTSIAVDEFIVYEVITETKYMAAKTSEEIQSQHYTSVQTIVSNTPEPKKEEAKSETRALKVIKDNKTGSTTNVKGNYYALIIGVQNYTHNSIKDLQFPIRDAKMFRDVLVSKYSFASENIVFLEDPNRSQIYKAFNQLRSRITENDNLIIFYAGHGYYDEKVKEGYWLPSNAEEGDDSGWIANSGLRTKIDAIHSKHTLLISDACFGGSIFKPSRSAFSDAGRSIVQSYDKVSRKGMTSGTLKTVPDESVFMKYLLKALRENKKKYLTASSLFYSFNEAVGNNSFNVPQFGVLFQVGDEGGQFVFINPEGTTGN
ncbi:caspase family protein [Flammeovirga sp. EKP202]|uniref:caspase family protein n=1 Tax=Flammeovirga sp. EKP202 TaxID=2770592 RepID=UPI00165FD713|nr:caspase family protein [Flammeovirga sp. EKP202]MBD0403261.1 caspase family protein [Flammeovirga sp. EKP202]